MMDKKLGIVGGGQLACLLFEATKTLKIPSVLFIEDKNVPAFNLGYPCVIGDIKSDGFKDFVNAVDVITFENEWIDTHELLKYADHKEFIPKLNTLKLLQDKIFQKNTLIDLNISTAPFEVMESKGSIEASLSKYRQKYGDFVLKWSRYGYDGKGVCFSHQDNSNLIKFCEEGFSKKSKVYVEAKIPFQKELALVCVRGKNGDFFSYPLVTTRQKSGVCEWVMSDPSIPQNLQHDAQKQAQRIVDHLKYSGVLALEFFLTHEGNLMINEMAPRVHNSGHYSLTASSVSQFENHVRAVMGMDIMPAQNMPYFAMLNLLGPSGVHLKLDDNFQPPHGNVGDLYWYAKKEIKPSRKMGHINISENNMGDFDLRLEALKAVHKQWTEGMTK